MAYDAARQRVVLYGGTTATGMFLGDTWEWDGTNWTQRFPANSPGPRDNPGMTYASLRRTVVLYGGQLPNFQFATDTWEWDGTNWTLLATTGPWSAYPAIAYDRLRQRIVMLQGPYTYEFTGTNWIRLSPAIQPPYTWKHAMNSDSIRGRVVVYGGAPLGPLTWEWDGTNWRQRLPATNPGRRDFFAMAYDPFRRRILLFRGADLSNNFFNDTWEYGPASPATYTTFGSGCPGSAGIPTLAAATFSLPWIDDTFTVEVGNLILGSPVFLAAGLSNTSWQGRPLPLSLGSYGMPGCNALVSVDAVTLAFATGSSLSFGIPICNCPTLIGTTFHHQALVLDPAGSAVVSNAATGVVGGR